jgi:hypothetical protein
LMYSFSLCITGKIVHLFYSLTGIINNACTR